MGEAVGEDVEPRLVSMATCAMGTRQMINLGVTACPFPPPDKNSHQLVLSCQKAPQSTDSNVIFKKNSDSKADNDPPPNLKTPRLARDYIAYIM